MDLFYYGLSSSYWKLQDTANAIASLDKAVELAPQNSIYLVNRGRLNYLINNKKDACDDFGKAALLGNEKAQNLQKKCCSPVEPNLFK